MTTPAATSTMACYGCHLDAPIALTMAWVPVLPCCNHSVSVTFACTSCWDAADQDQKLAWASAYARAVDPRPRGWRRTERIITASTIHAHLGVDSRCRPYCDERNEITVPALRWKP